MTFSGNLTLIARVREFLKNLAVLFRPSIYSATVSPTQYSATVVESKGPSATLKAL